MKRWATVAAVLAIAGGSVGADCRTPSCADARTDSESAPLLTEFDLNNQLTDDPWTLVFAVTFEDTDGDVSGGVAEFFLNGNRSDTQLELFDLFRQSALTEDATGGRFGLPLRFSENVEDGAKVTLGLQLIDQAGNRSNCFSIDLEFSVGTLAQSTPVDCGQLAGLSTPSKERGL